MLKEGPLKNGPRKMDPGKTIPGLKNPCMVPWENDSRIKKIPGKMAAWKNNPWI